MIALMLASGCCAVIAGEGDRDRGDRYAAARDVREQRQAVRQERQRDVRAVQEMQQQGPQRMQPQYEQPQYQPQQQDNGRRGSRMSPEERRALRRQIDQASHDIYVPSR
jgi:hypothetical protein